MALKVFNQSGDFAAFNAAESWCRSSGFSVGRMQGDAPIGLLRGDFDISKWRNMTKAEISQLDGIISGDKRNGPVIVEIKEPPLPHAKEDAKP